MVGWMEATVAERKEATRVAHGDRIEEILERAAEFFESYLWESKTGRGVRARLADAGVDEETLRRFRIGYAPEGHKDLLHHLARWNYSADELHEAGVATRSRRGHAHVHFRSRVMFPVRTREGELLGFVGLATHLGPSWPLWMTSPDRGRYRKASAIFAIDQAGPGIAKAGRAKVLSDCLEVVRMHQRGGGEAVAVVQSPVTYEHLGQLAPELGGSADELGLLRERGREEGSADILVVGPRAELGEGAFTLDNGDDAVLEEASGAQRAAAAPDASASWHARLIKWLGAALIGLGVPLFFFALVHPSKDDPGGPTTGFGAAVIGVVAVYVGLALFVGFVSARADRKSTSRRMRAPWMTGAGEWQPSAWTYHQLEEVLIGAACLSIPVLLVLFVAIGGFG